MKTICKMLALGMIGAGAAISPFESDACTRVIYHGADSLYIVGRSLDWRTPIPTNLYVYPKGIYKQGASTPDGINWTSKYGAVYAVSYDGGITEGMNEKVSRSTVSSVKVPYMSTARLRRILPYLWR